MAVFLESTNRRIENEDGEPSVSASGDHTISVATIPSSQLSSSSYATAEANSANSAKELLPSYAIEELRGARPPRGEAIEQTLDDESKSAKSMMSHLSFKSNKTAKSLKHAILQNRPVQAHDKQLLRRVRDFKFAQRKRRLVSRERATPIGILGIYQHLQGVRRDVEWAEDAAWRRTNHEPYLKWRDFELEKNNEVNSKSYFTILLCVALVAIMIWEFSVNDWQFAPLRDNPLLGVSGQTLIDCGAKVTYLIVNYGQFWRLFTAMFLHSGLVHLFFNVIVLVFVGRGVELAHGTHVAALAFVIGGYGGNVLSALFLPQYVSVGASGGIFSLLGVALADILMNFHIINGSGKGGDAVLVRTRKEKRMVKWVIFWLILDVSLNVVIGLLPFVDNFCHVGGMVFGFLLGVGVLRRVTFTFFGFNRTGFQKFFSMLAKAWGIIILTILLAFTTTWLFQFSDGYTTACHGCRYVNCLSLPFWGAPNEKWWYCDDCVQAYG